MTSKREKIQLISVVILILIFSYFLTSANYAFTTFISSNYTSQELENLASIFHNMDNINSLLIDTKTIQNQINNQIGSYDFLSLFGLFLTTLILGVILFFNLLKKNSEKIIEILVPKWDILNHFRLITTIIFGVFVAIAVTYLSSINFILLLRDQTIITTVSMMIINNPQPEMMTSLLSTYLANNMSEYLLATQGFYYFIISLIFPGLALIHYQIKEKPTFWNLVFITATFFTVPYWIIQII